MAVMFKCQRQTGGTVIRLCKKAVTDQSERRQCKEQRQKKQGRHQQRGWHEPMARCRAAHFNFCAGTKSWYRTGRDSSHNITVLCHSAALPPTGVYTISMPSGSPFP